MRRINLAFGLSDAPERVRLKRTLPGCATNQSSRTAGRPTVEMKLRIRNKWTSPRRWAWWTVFPVFLVLAATAQAGGLPDAGIDLSEGPGASGSKAVGPSNVAVVPQAVRGAHLGPAAPAGAAQSIPPATGHNVGPEEAPIGLPTPEPRSASTGTADRGADARGALGTPRKASGVMPHASDAQTRVIRQLAETLGPAAGVLRAGAFAAIDYLRAQLAGTIRRIDPQLPSTPHRHEPPAGTVRDWSVAPGTGASHYGSAISVTRGELNAANGGTRSAPESSSDQLGTHRTTARAELPQSGHPASPSASHSPASGLGSATQILVPLGLAAALCGFAAPAMRRRFIPRAGWLRSALLASPLEQPG
jgi:hypothetical protein